MKPLLLSFLLLTVPFPAKHQTETLSIPQTQAIPQNITESMNRQEDRLDQIQVRVAEINTSLTDFKDDTQKQLGVINIKLDDMSITNGIAKFFLYVLGLMIPGLACVWLADYLKRRNQNRPPEAEQL